MKLTINNGKYFFKIIENFSYASRTDKNWVETLNSLYPEIVFLAKSKSAQRVKGIISRKYDGVQRLVSKLGLVSPSRTLYWNFWEVFRLRKGSKKGG